MVFDPDAVMVLPYMRPLMVPLWVVLPAAPERMVMAEAELH